VLPAIQDLGWDVAPANTAATVEPAKPTVITSDKQELFTSPNGNVYWFTGHVKIEGGSLQGVCDNMKVEASPQQAAGTGAASAASPSAIKSIVAAGFVRITQGTRVATAGQAKILPSEGKIILTDHPTVDDGGNGAHADGGVIELDRNDRDAHVSGAPGAPDSPPVRPRFSLPLNNIDNPLKSSDKTSTKNSP
jgi:lipopolysaccharide export system protein LptA